MRAGAARAASAAPLMAASVLRGFWPGAVVPAGVCAGGSVTACSAAYLPESLNVAGTNRMPRHIVEAVNPRRRVRRIPENGYRLVLIKDLLELLL